MSDSLYVASGLFVFVLCVAVHWALYATSSPRVRVADLDRRRQALLRWFALLAVWELAVLALIAVYVALARQANEGFGAWTAPALGALAGNTLPLQLTVIAISRATR